MTEGDPLPKIAESKPEPSHQVQAIRNEIKEFAGSQAALLSTIETQEAEIKELKTALRILAKNYIRVDCDRVEERGLTSHLDPIHKTDPFFKEDDSLIEHLKIRHPYIFQEGGENPRMYGSPEWVRRVPDLMLYGNVKNPRTEPSCLTF